MSRKTDCLLSTEGYLHVYNRGVDRGTLFFQERDYDFFMELLAKGLESLKIELLLHCLLPNHFHLVVHQSEAYAISKYMKELCGGYARHLNWARLRSGHLFQGRFNIKLVEDPASLIRLSRYVHYNPVMAGLVKTASQWKYSSYQAYVGSAAQELVTVGPILRLVGGKEKYLRFLRDYDPSDPESAWTFIAR